MISSSSLISKLIVTKLSPPPLHSKFVHRARLNESLRVGMKKKLTCVIAPAGFGKTMLLSEWNASLKAAKWRTAWISLDEADNEPNRFWGYFFAALGEISPDIKDLLGSITRQDYPPNDLAFITTLINAISLIPDESYLILDNYQAIDNEAVHDDLNDLLRYLPGNMHLVIASRKELPLYVSRLLAKNEVVEIRSDALKFTLAEATTFLTQVMKIKLSSHHINRLSYLTEGWITGLVLAAPSLQQLTTRTEIDNFIANFSGDYHYILNFLTVEVLDRLPPEQKEFLLKCSILEELNAPLCNTILDRSDSQSMLNVLDAANLFLQPINDQRQAYRFHPLFSDILHSHLKRSFPKDEIDHLHRLACDWYRMNEQISHAIPHAMASGNEDLAAEIIEAYICTPHGTSVQSMVILDWFKQLPPRVLEQHLDLKLYRAMMCLVHGYLEQAKAILTEIELSAQKATSPTTETQPMQKAVDAIRAAIRCVEDSSQDSILNACQVLNTLDDPDSPQKILLEYYLALAYQTCGDLTFDLKEWINTIESLYLRRESSGYLFHQLQLAHIYEQRGELYMAAHVYQQAIDYIQSNELQDNILSIVIDMRLSEIYREWNDLEIAGLLACKARERFLQYRVGEPCWQHSTDICLLMARNCISNHALEDARMYLDIATRRAQMTNSIPSLMTSVDEVRVHYWLANNDLNKATAWARNKVKIAAKASHGECLIERLLIARIMLAGRHPDEALAWLDELIPELEVMNQGRRLFEAILLRALALWESNRRDEAVNTIQGVLSRAERENYVSTWLELHPHMLELLRAAQGDLRASGGEASIRDYLYKIIAGLQETHQVDIPEQGKVVDLSFEKLTDREDEVLSLLASGLSANGIAQTLTITTSTAKTHIRNIYQKLGVNTRVYALERANDLGIISKVHRPSPINENSGSDYYRDN